MEGYVYLVGETDTPHIFKIGATRTDVENRKLSLQTGNNKELYVKSFFKSHYPFKLEKMLHRHFFNKKIMNEWFELTDSEMNDFNLICEKYESSLLSLQDNPFFNK